jgi:hypothetical protein
VALLLGLVSITVPRDTLILSVVLYIVVPVIVAQLWRRALLAKDGQAALGLTLRTLAPLSLSAGRQRQVHKPTLVTRKYFFTVPLTQALRPRSWREQNIKAHAMDDIRSPHKTAECWLALAQKINDSASLQALNLLPEISARTVARLAALRSGDLGTAG